ncbi:uncharacterized protein LOC141600878 [Silene latifolia]|uniref:uncharacterized protein LOC141600878 n=1 Tax=Silene latifolia TaxID=37657 RepID=UPI003D7839CC
MEEACSVNILNKMPIKLYDPGSFSIPCVVGGVLISRALCDFGASVSVIPLKVAKKIGIHSLAPTTMTLQLADKSVKRSLGGRPFLATGGVLIDVRNGRLTYRIEGDNVEFNLPNLMTGPKVERMCTIEVIDEVVELVAREESEMKEAFQISLYDEEME